MQINNSGWSLTSASISIAWAFSFSFTSFVIGRFPELNRWTGVLLLVAPAFGAFQSSPSLSPDIKLNTTYSRFVLILFSHMVALCFLPESRASMIKEKTDGADKSWVKGWKRAYNARGIGLIWENPYLWPGQKSTIVFAEPLASHLKDKPIDAPASRHNLATRGKWSAISIRLGYIILNYIAMSFFEEYRVSATVGFFTDEDLSPEKEGILRRGLQQLYFNKPLSPISYREVQIRALMVVNRFLPDIFYLSIFHDLLAVFFIAVGIDESWEWPPLFGSITQAYTMRRFWASFWHRLVYKSFSFHASALTKTLHMQQGTVFSRILNNWLVFILSAIMHAAVLSKHGSTSCAWGRGTLVIWCIQPLSFVLEGVVQSYWRQVKKNSFFWVNQSIMSTFERAVGYCWVFAWLLWITPKTVFPLVHCKA